MVVAARYTICADRHCFLRWDDLGQSRSLRVDWRRVFYHRRNESTAARSALNSHAFPLHHPRLALALMIDRKNLFIGGLLAVGFDASGEFLLAVSHSGRGVYS